MSERARDEILRLAGVRKSYNIGRPSETEVLHGIALLLARDDFAALTGPSGSGKSTLLNLIGLLDKPTAGEVYLLERATSTLDDAARTALRADAIGFVFQFHYLIEAFTALENVLMARMVAHGRPDRETVDWARSLLDAVGLADFTERKPGELSGGQQQRVAIARALATKPALLLADEPTGNLDPATSDKVFAALSQLIREQNTGCIIATHNHDLARKADRIVTIVDGVIIPTTL